MNRKFLLIILLFLVISLGIMNIYQSYSANIDLNKIDKNIIKDGEEYEIELSVAMDKEPGYNIVFLIDATSINDANWQNYMRPALIEASQEFLPYENVEKNVNKIAVIGHGISGNVYTPLTNNAKDLEKLPESSANGLIAPGRPASNAESGFFEAETYLKSLTDLKKSKEKTIVIYMSDGSLNQSDKKVDFYKLVQDGAKYGKYKVMDLQYEYLLQVLEYLYSNPNIKRIEIMDNMINGLKELYKEANPDVDISTLTFSSITGGISTENLNSKLSEYVLNLHKYIGYDTTKEYKTSEFEKMFYKIQFLEDESYNSLLQDLFFLEMIVVSHPRTEVILRAVDGGNSLSEIAKVYTFGYNGGTGLSSDYTKKLLDPEFVGSATYEANTKDNHYSEKFFFATNAKIKEGIQSLTEEISKTSITNIKVEEYTSKWVIPIDINNDGIFDINDIKIKSGYTDSEIAEIVVEESKDSTEIEDPDITTNNKNKIYKINWSIPITLKSWEEYKISYRVKLDKEETGIIDGEDYKTNSTSTISYDVINLTDGSITETINKEVNSPYIHYEIEKLEPEESVKEENNKNEEKDENKNELDDVPVTGSSYRIGSGIIKCLICFVVLLILKENKNARKKA